MRICLFDWNQGGHHAEILRSVAEALRPGAEVVVAAPEAALTGAGELDARQISLGAGRPRPAAAAAEGIGKAELANEELDLVESVLAEVKPDHLILLWADPVLRWLLQRPPLPTAVSLYLFIAPIHQGWAYGDWLGPRETAAALFKEMSVMRWMRRRDAHALFAFDPEAARRWARFPRSKSLYLPEPPLNYRTQPLPAAERNGCLLFGYLDPRKGIDRVADALEEGCEGLQLRLYGEPAPEYADRLQHEIERMRAGGVEIETRLERLPYEEAMDSLAAARVALLSFGWSAPGSRVLLEAATAGTPVVGARIGVVGQRIRRNGLGFAVAPDDPAALRRAIRGLALSPDATERYEPTLRAYAERLNSGFHRAQIRRAFGLAEIPA